MNSKILLAFICVFFLLTRLYKITEIPVSVYWDEASIGYNAYSISQTGKDEWGESFPLHFRAFGEFKLPVYIYSTAIFVKLFGLNEFSVRISAVLFSLGIVILTYLLTKKISGKDQIGLWSSFFVSISPWFFIFSRTGFEATAGLMFYLLGIYLFLNFTKNYFIFFAMLSFILSAYSYNSFRIIIPLTILVLLGSQWRYIKKGVVKWIIFSGLLVALSIIPIYRLYVYDAGISRLQNIGSVSGVAMVRNYLSHFDPQFLFISGDKNQRHQQAGFGQLYLPDGLLLLSGFVYMFKSKNKYKWLPLVLTLLGPIPAAITKESPHALRSLSSIPFISMIGGMGAFYISQINKKIMPFVLIGATLSFFTYYFINFLNVFPAHSADEWQYNYKKIFTQTQEDFESQEKILISDKEGQPYIFALYYLRYDPEKFRTTVVRNSVDKWGFSTVKKFGKFEFGE